MEIWQNSLIKKVHWRSVTLEHALAANQFMQPNMYTSVALHNIVKSKRALVNVSMK